MKEGLVIGKFLPLHKGHIALIEFALENCEHINVILCHSDSESIPGSVRLNWLKKSFVGNGRISIIDFGYDEKELPNTSVSSKETSRVWSKALSKKVQVVDVIFSSEPYGDCVAEYFGCKHMLFDIFRKSFTISGSQIMGSPVEYCKYIADAAKPYFVKKIALVGTESTGKSTLTEKLAKEYKTAFVPEMAREIIEKTDECRYEHLQEIAILQATTVLTQSSQANRILFVDTELNITKSYALCLFKKELITAHWIENANKFDLYLYLENDCPFVQDGTRLSVEERDKLDKSHKEQFIKAGIPIISITGNWDERFQSACAIINSFFKINN